MSEERKMIIEFCSCHHLYQDEQNGKQMRMKNKTISATYRCTVCGEVKKT